MATDALQVGLSAPPVDGQLVYHDGITYVTKQEGSAYILIPPDTQTTVVPPSSISQTKAEQAPALKPQNVFYNPIQQFNRDLSVLAIKAFGDDWVDQRTRNDKKRVRGARSREQKSKKRKLEENGEDSNISEVVSKLQSLQDDTHESSEFPTKLSPAADEPAATTAITTDASSNAPKFRILDALSASGLRALRYAKEIPAASSIVANDMSSNAIKSMKMNIEHNGLKDKITPNLGDAIGHMYTVAYPPQGSHGPKHINLRYDVIDLDPYGTAVPFLDAALQALNNGGLLCVTCTDSGVFNSTGYSEKTYALYGGMPVKGAHAHEGGLRLILNSIATCAAKYGLAIEPLLSLSIDFYARVFVRVSKSPADVKFLAGKTMLVYNCDSGCGAYTTQLLSRNIRQQSKSTAPDWFKYTIAQSPTADRLCEHCESKTHIAGPMWAGPLHNAAFIQKVLLDLKTADRNIYKTTDRIEGMLSTALDELNVNDELTRLGEDAAPVSKRDPNTDEGIITTEVVVESAPPVHIPKLPAEVHDPHPFYFSTSSLCKVVHCIAPPDAAVKGALRHAGYRAVRSHCQPGVIKTDAPWTFIWRMIRAWVRERSPIKEGGLRKEQPGWEIMYGETARAEEDEAKSGDDATNGNQSNGEQVDDEKPKKLKIVFDEVLGREKPGKKLVRYQQNPRENWGPMTKAKGN